MSGTDVVGTGFAVLDRIYAGEDQTAFEELGGSCANVLISLAMLQRNVAPVLRLGLDDVGGRLVNAFHHAGAQTRFIEQRADFGSPVLCQQLDILSGVHSFVFQCPETDVEFPKYQPIDNEDVERALPVITDCAVFYTDRVSIAIIEAMEAAQSAGSIVYFEPSDIQDEQLFRRALAAASIVKFSIDRLEELPDELAISGHAILIVTHGSAGLEVRQGETRKWLQSHPAPYVRDTCGSGDMVTVGIIDWLLSRRPENFQAIFGEFLHGIDAGQRLAAENCAYIGARGLFLEKGADYARSVLNN